MAQVAVMSPDGSVKKIDRDSKEGLQALRKLSALMLKVALKQEFKGIRLGEAVADEDGFHVDSDKDNQQVSADELPALEDVIKGMAKNDAKVQFVEVPVEDALTEVEAELHQTLMDKRSSVQALTNSINNVKNAIETKSRAIKLENENAQLREQQHNQVEELDKTEKEIEERNQLLLEEEEHIRAAQFQLAGKEAELERVILQLQDVANEDEM